MRGGRGRTPPPYRPEEGAQSKRRRGSLSHVGCYEVGAAIPFPR